MKDVLQVAGQVAGLGGIGVVTFLVIAKAIIGKTRDVNQSQSFMLLNRILIAAILVTVLGIVAWVVSLAIDKEYAIDVRIDTPISVSESHSGPDQSATIKQHLLLESYICSLLVDGKPHSIDEIVDHVATELDTQTTDRLKGQVTVTLHRWLHSNSRLSYSPRIGIVDIALPTQSGWQLSSPAEDSYLLTHIPVGDPSASRGASQLTIA